MFLKENEHCYKANSTKKNPWYLDSGCSRHMTGDKNLFMDLKPKNGGDFTFGDNSKGKIEGIGIIDNKSSIFIENVLLVNGLKHNLLSISQLCDKGFKVVFECMNCHVIDVRTNKDYFLWTSSW